MTNIKHIFKVREPVRPIFSAVPRIPQEDYTIRKNIDTKEGTILKVPVNPYDIANKSYVDSKVGTAAVADHSSLSNLSYASAGHTGFVASASLPVTGVDFDPVGTDNSDDNAVNTLYSGLISYTGTASDIIDTHIASSSIHYTEASIDHSAVTNLSYASSGHTGFSSTGPVALNTAKVSYTGLAGDHGTAATDEIVNVCYGTSATPPTASTTTEGALYIQYTA